MADPMLQQAYGYAALLADIPELAGLLEKAVAENWTPEVIQAAVLNSEWARSKRQTQIEWELEQRLRPQDAEARKADLIVKIRKQATDLGFTLTDARLNTVAGWILNHGLSDEEAQQTILAEFHYNPAQAKGSTATQAAQLTALAKQFLVPMSEQAIGEWVDRILHQKDTIDSFTEYLRDQAKSMFPSLAGMIDSGHSVSSLLDPYAQLVQRELGVVNVDFTDPKFMGALMQVDPKTGERSMMNLEQWQTHLRTDPRFGWDNTVNAQNMTAGFTTALLEFMEAV